jgi:hypothetical protein
MSKDEIAKLPLKNRKKLAAKEAAAADEGN